MAETPEIKCSGEFLFNDHSGRCHPNGLEFAKRNYSVKAEWMAAPNVKSLTSSILNPTHGLIEQNQIGHALPVLDVGSVNAVRDIIDLEKPTELEKYLLDVAFSPTFSIETWRGIDREERRSLNAKKGGRTAEPTR